jgi:hypothetical protein
MADHHTSIMTGTAHFLRHTRYTRYFSEIASTLENAKYNIGTEKNTLDLRRYNTTSLA